MSEKKPCVKCGAPRVEGDRHFCPACERLWSEPLYRAREGSREFARKALGAARKKLERGADIALRLRMGEKRADAREPEDRPEKP